jgi:uncharacterized membrane protein YkoI
MDNKNHTVMHLVGLSSIALGLAFMISPNNHSALAQQLNSSNSGGNSSSGTNKTISITMTPNTQQQQQQNTYSMGMRSGLQNQNWTGSISLFSPMLDMFKSKIHTTLNSAITSAISAVGGAAGSNASAAAVAAFIHPENGFLVYNVFVLDPNNTIHRIIVDPGNGKVLSNQPMSMMEMMSMMHPSMGMGTDGMMMDNGMGMMQHGMMMGGGAPDMGMMGRPGMMVDRSMMDDGMGMMGSH